MFFALVFVCLFHCLFILIYVGVAVIYNPENGTVLISGISNANLSICIQVESRQNSDGIWMENGICHANDTIQAVARNSLIRTKACSTLPPGKCSRWQKWQTGLKLQFYLKGKKEKKSCCVFDVL